MRAVKHAIKVPTCAVCDNLVERFEWEYSPEDDTYMYRAYCHGQKQQVKLTSIQIEKSNIDLLNIMFDRVFEGLSE